MRKVWMATLLVGLFTMAAMAFQPAAATNDQAMAKKIESLLGMSAAERRTQLKNMDPAERRGLWFQLKKEERARKGKLANKNNYQTITPMAVSVPGDTPYLTAEEAIGTVVYDSGFPTIGFGGGAIIGNRFNSHTGLPMLTSGTISSVNALVVPGPANTTSSAGFVITGPQTTMGGAMAIFSTFTVATGVVDSLNFTGIGTAYTGLSYFVLFGDFASVYIPVYGTGTTMGQGHHGVVGYTGGMGPNITGTFDFGGALNSFIRTTGNIVPVELMTFEIE